MTDYQRGVEQASAVYQEVINEYVTENDKLREQGERLFDKTLELATENEKLRELVRDLYMALWTCNQHTCKHGNDGCYTEDGNSGGRCTLHDRMYELGVGL